MLAMTTRKKGMSMTWVRAFVRLMASAILWWIFIRFVPGTPASPARDVLGVSALAALFTLLLLEIPGTHLARGWRFLLAWFGTSLVIGLYFLHPWVLNGISWASGWTAFWIGLGTGLAEYSVGTRPTRIRREF